MLTHINTLADRISARYQKLNPRQRGLFAVLAYSVAFLVFAIAVQSPMILKGRSIVWRYDSSAEHFPASVYFIQSIRQLLSGGGFSQYSFSLGFGGDVISTLNFYGFGDPALAVVALIPTDNFELLFALATFLRQWLAGMFVYGYLREMGVRRSHALIAAVSYAFCAFVNRNTLRHQNFLCAPMLLPLIVWGFERVLKKKGLCLLALSVALMALSTYYFLYMTSLFLLMYALIRFFMESPVGERKRAFLPLFGRAMGAYLIGILMAGVILMPAVYGFFQSARMPNRLQENVWTHQSIPYFLASVSRYLYPRNVGFDTVALWSVFAVMALMLRKKTAQQRPMLWIVGLISFYLISPSMMWAFNGFSYVSNRSVYLLSLLASCALAYGIREVGNLTRWKLAVICGFTLFELVIFVMALFMFEDMSNMLNLLYAAATSGVAVVTVGMLVLVNTQPFRKLRWMPLIVASAMVVINLGANELIYSSWRYMSGQFVRAGAVQSGIANSPGSAADHPDENDFYRIEVSESGFDVRNESLLLGYPATSSYFSVQHKSNLEPLTALELRSRPMLHHVKGLDERAALLSALGVRQYVAKPGSPHPYGFTLESETDKYAVYENENALPLGYSADAFITKSEFDALDGLAKQQALISAAVLGDERASSLDHLAFADERVAIPHEITAMTELTYENGMLDVQKTGASMTIRFEGMAGGETYLRLTRFDVDSLGSVRLTVSGNGLNKEVRALSNTTNEYHYGQYNYLINLGHDHAGDVTLTFHDAGKMGLESLDVFAVPMAGFEAKIEKLAAQPLTNLRISSDKIEGDVQFDGERALILPIPYSAGWTATVDGAAHEIDGAAGLTMALVIPEGAHHIELQYANPWMKIGLLMSATGCLLMILICIRKNARSLLEPAGEM